MKLFRLYAKHPGQKRFRPINWNTGLQVGNLIYGSVFTEDEKQDIERVDIPANPTVDFEFRPANF